jgi:hypothetical protein
MLLFSMKDRGGGTDAGGVGFAGAAVASAFDGKIVLRNDNKEFAVVLGVVLPSESSLLDNPAFVCLDGVSFLNSSSSAEKTEAGDGRDLVGVDLDLDSISLED